MRRLLSIFLLFLGAHLGVSAGDSLQLHLQRFDQASTAAEQLTAANDFFRQLHSEEFIDTLLIYSAATPTDTLREQVWYWTAEYCYDRQQYSQAEHYASMALPLFRAGNDRTGQADCLNLLAITCTRLGNYEEAAGYAQQCYRLDDASGDAERIVASLNSLAAIHIAANQPTEAEKYVLKGLKMAEDSHQPSRRAVLLGMASEVYHAMGDDRKAVDYADEAYRLDTELGNDYKAMVRLSQRASALIGLHQYEEARQVLATVVPYFRQVGDRHSLGISLNKMGMALRCLERQQEAVACFRRAADIFVALGDKTNEMHARRGLYESYWKQYPDSAKMELDRFNDLKDSLYQGASAESLARYNAEFGNDWLQQQNEAERTAKRRVLLVAIVVIAVLLLLTLLGWWAMRRRQQHVNRQFTANIEELREKYKELAVRYDNALVTGSGAQQHEELAETDRLFLEKAVDIVNEMMYSGQVDAESLASQLGMSLFLLRQRLQTLTGETPQTFIANIRMRRARHLLDNRPELNVSQVAQLCAYNDAPNFSRAFKKTFGVTPTQYVEKQRQQSGL